MQQEAMRIGLDFGGVIVESRKQVAGEDTGIGPGREQVVPREGVFEAVRQITTGARGRVWIVSKAGARMQRRTLAWLEAVDFFARTGLAEQHVRFCLERSEKQAICRELGLTHFVDDRIHVMQILRHTVPHLFLFGESGGERWCPPWARFVTEWSQVVEGVSAWRG